MGTMSDVDGCHQKMQGCISEGHPFPDPEDKLENFASFAVAVCDLPACFDNVNECLCA